MPKLPVKRYSLFDCLSNATTGLCVTYSVSAVATEASAIELRPIEVPQQYGPDNTGEGADSGDTALSDILIIAGTFSAYAIRRELDVAP
jgi:hypothetical protein